MTNYKLTLQEYAMRYGTGMGVLWTLKFMLFPLGLRIPILQFQFFVLTLGVPLVGYIFAKRFRDRNCNGHLSFSRAFLFTTFMYLFASLFVAVAHYIYFRYIDGGFVIQTYQDMWNQLKQTADADLLPALQQYDEAFQLIASLTPLELTFQLVSNNIFIGTLLALPTALLVMNKKKIQ